MRGFDHLSIVLANIKEGGNHYTFELDDQFFSSYEACPISQAKYNVDLCLTRNRNMIEARVVASGHYQTECDRCTATIQMPQESESIAYIEITDEPNPEDTETYYVSEADHKLEVGQIIYNEIIINKPMLHIYDCDDEEEPPCDDDVLDRLDGIDEEEEQLRSPWNVLKDINLNN